MTHEALFAVPALLLLLLAPPCVGLYDPKHRIESARIYGNIDAFAYYYVDMLVGTPPQRVSLIVDTGSGVTAFPCRSCRHCGRHIDPNFDFERSKTAKWVPCGGKCTATCRGGHCQYHQGYTEGSSITGWYFLDQVSLGDAIQRNPPVQSTMGCHQDENRLFYTQKANGIMGIRPPAGRGAPTIFEQLWADKAHVNSKIFALCLGEWGGRLVVGGHNESYHKGPIQWTSVSTKGGYYQLALQAFVVDGQEIRGPFGTAMVDSGTTYTYMGRTPYRNLRQSIESYCSRHNNCNARQMGSCYEAKDLSGFPKVEVLLQGVRMRWPAKAYLYRKGSGNRWCYSFEDDGPGANTVLGASWMLHHEVIFDLEAKKVGIVEADCPEYRKRPEHDEKQDMTPPALEQQRAEPAVAAAAAAKLRAKAAPTPAPQRAPTNAPTRAPTLPPRQAATKATTAAPPPAPSATPAAAVAAQEGAAAPPSEQLTTAPAVPHGRGVSQPAAEPSDSGADLTAALNLEHGIDDGQSSWGTAQYVLAALGSVAVFGSIALGVAGRFRSGGGAGLSADKAGPNDKERQRPQGAYLAPDNVGLAAEDWSDLGEDDPLVASVDKS